MDEQIVRYKNEREGIQNYIKAVGATADTTTLQQFNAQLLEITANITDLESKKQSAAAEVSSIARIRERLARMKAAHALFGADGPTEHSRRFIRLACEGILLDKYSAHFITLTIIWAAPFRQIDICFIYRPDGARQDWSAQDETDLACLFPEADRMELFERFPTRSWKGIMTWAYRLGLRRSKGSPNTATFLDDSLSLADWRLLQEHGWELPETKYGSYWLYNVEIAGNRVESGSSPW